MPKIAEFYGIIVYMNFYDVHPHQLPYVHAQYRDEEVSVSIFDGTVLAGRLPRRRLNLLKKWNLAVSGKNTFEIEPLK